MPFGHTHAKLVTPVLPGQPSHRFGPHRGARAGGVVGESGASGVKDGLSKEGEIGGGDTGGEAIVGVGGSTEMRSGRAGTAEHCVVAGSRKRRIALRSARKECGMF